MSLFMQEFPVTNLALIIMSQFYVKYFQPVHLRLARRDSGMIDSFQQGMRIIFLLLVCYISLCFSFKILTHSRRTKLYAKKITPTGDDSMDEYRKAVVNALQSQSSKDGEFGARDMLELIIKKWGVAYDVQLRKNTPFGEGSGNIYVNIMWRYFGQKSFPMDEREYLEHLEALCRYMKSIDRIDHFKQKVAESRKRPNSYFGYAVPIPLDVDPLTADSFFGELDEQS